MKTNKKVLIAAAVSGILSAGMLSAVHASDSGAESAGTVVADKGSCKGKSGCNGSCNANTCKNSNKCKGKKASEQKSQTESSKQKSKKKEAKPESETSTQVQVEESDANIHDDKG